MLGSDKTAELRPKESSKTFPDLRFLPSLAMVADGRLEPQPGQGESFTQIVALLTVDDSEHWKYDCSPEPVGSRDGRF